MNSLNTKQASILLEVVFSILLLAIVSTSAILIYKNFFEIHQEDYKNEITNIELLNTKYFLQKNISSSASLSQLRLEEKSLYFKDAVLLQEVTLYEQTIQNNRAHFKICIQNRRCKNFTLSL